MSFDAKRLYELLPAVYRLRDAEEGLPLESVLKVTSEQVAVIEENLAQLYDDQFIETCAEWVVPYIGDLVGARGLYDLTGAVSQRAQVANTLRYRRGKGTAAVLEQLARDVSGWPSHAVEFFGLLATTQYMNHIRPDNRSPDLRRWEPLERASTPFESLAHIVDVRRIASGRGKYNIPNIGIFVWRLGAYPLTSVPARKVAAGSDDRRFRFSPLGNDVQLYNHPQIEERITQLARPTNVPMPISRRVLDTYLEDYYGTSVLLFEGEEEVKANRVVVCDLSGWTRKPKDKYAIDPVLGRIAAPEENPAPSDLRVTYHYAFSANMGGGEYDRSLAPLPADQVVRVVSSADSPERIREALEDVRGGGLLEIADSGRYGQLPGTSVTVGGRSLEVRARNGHRPSIELGGELHVTITEDTEVTLDGLLVSGATLRVSAGPNSLGRLRLRHCTLVPGLDLLEDGAPRYPSEASLVVASANISVEIDHCIVGGLRVSEGSSARITNSIVDATSEDGLAYSAPGGNEWGGTLHVENSTIIGSVSTRLLDLAQNTIFLASPAERGSTIPPLDCERTQQGCVRFSYVPPGARIPRRYRCAPQDPQDTTETIRVRPLFSSLRYGNPDYCQLSQLCAPEIRQGADDEAEMGAFHELYQPQRKTNVRLRLEEYLRFGLEAGVFYAS